MEQPVNYKHKIDFLISDNTPSTQPTRNSQNRYKKCNESVKPKQSGNQVIDDFIRYTQKFIAEGGFSKIYKAIWELNEIASSTK
ncbi:unnamed protein product [Rhizophagus irregularis]|nr:unnamed protein product [Rhizophagus irregularis]